MIDERAAKEKYRQAKSWGQEQAQAADQARRDLSAATDAVAAAEQARDAAVAEAEGLAVRLSEAEARTANAVADAKSASKFAGKAAALDAIKKALDAPVKSDWDDDAVGVEEKAERFDRLRALLTTKETK